MMRVGLGLLVMLAVSVQAQTGALTTIKAETGNNSGVTDVFQGMSNGQPRGGNVSPLPISSLLPASTPTRFIAHLMPNFSLGCGTEPRCEGHVKVGYESDDAEEVARQLTDMQRRGFSVVWLDWFGTAIAHHDEVGKKMMRESERMQKAGMPWNFLLQPDHGAIRECYAKTGKDKDKNETCNTAKLIEILTYAAKTYFVSPAYLRVNGRPVVPFFWSRNTPVDWAEVKKKVPGNPLFVFMHGRGFSEAESDGSFSWNAITGPKDPGPEHTGLDYLDNFYAVAADKGKGKLVIGSAYAGFDDRPAGWAKEKMLLPQKCGVTWLETLRESLKYKQFSGEALPFLQVVTWNDYEEGSAVEPGVSNCVASIAAKVDGGKLSWSVVSETDKDGAKFDEATVAYYRVFVGVGKDGLQEIARVKPGEAKNVDVSGMKGKMVYVEAVGQAMVMNHLSSGVVVQ